MRFTVKAKPAPKPISKDASKIALIYAGILVVMAVAQLFTFEDFPVVISSYWLPGIGQEAAHFLAAFIVVIEVFSLPFLLRLKISTAMRVFSMILGWITSVFWLFIALWLQITVNSVASLGILGATIDVPAGWWAVAMTFGLMILSIWSSFGMWPLPNKKTR